MIQVSYKYNGKTQYVDFSDNETLNTFIDRIVKMEGVSSIEITNNLPSLDTTINSSLLSVEGY